MRLMRGAAVGGLATMLLAGMHTQLRLELIFVPVIATGLALLAERVLPRLRQLRRRPDGFAPPSSPLRT